MKRALGNQGAALIIVLLVMSILTAVVVEYSYGVFVSMDLLDNWKTHQKLSLVADSGASVAARIIKTYTRRSFSYPGVVFLPSYDAFKDGILVSLKIEDENAKFNINKLVSPNGAVVSEAYLLLVRLLDELGQDKAFADRIVDYIDRDSIPRVQGSEDDVKNAPLYDLQELMLVPGMTVEVYAKLRPNVTIYGSGRINLNAAELPVLKSLSSTVSPTMAQDVIDYRDEHPFEQTNDLLKVSGFKDEVGSWFIGHTTVKGERFHVYSEATSPGGMKRIVESVMDRNGNIEYWKEY
jgi:general secretion pathway protein K